jgi:uncharacterized membrane protein YfcA
MARPNLSYLKNLVLSLTGIICGVLTGMTVAAGSVTASPLVRYLLGLKPNRASATALSTTFFGALGAIYNYQLHDKVSWEAGIILAVSQVIGASVGRNLFGISKSTSSRLILSVIAIISGLFVMAYTNDVYRMSMSGLSFTIMHNGIVKLIGLFIVGIIIGVISHILDLGGILIIPACLLLLHMGPLASQGVALVVIMSVSLFGLLIYAHNGDIEIQSAWWMSLGAVFGGLVGSYIAFSLINEATLISLLGATICIIGLARFLTIGKLSKVDTSSR